MRKVVIQKSITSINDVKKDQIIVGFSSNYRTWYKLFLVGEPIPDKYQWFSLQNSFRSFDDPLPDLIESIEHFLKASQNNEVYVFDSFEQFLEEFPALVKKQ